MLPFGRAWDATARQQNRIASGLLVIREEPVKLEGT